MLVTSNSCRTPTTVRKVHNLNPIAKPIPIAVKIVDVIKNFHIMNENAIILMTMIITTPATMPLVNMMLLTGRRGKQRRIQLLPFKMHQQT